VTSDAGKRGGKHVKELAVGETWPEGGRRPRSRLSLLFISFMVVLGIAGLTALGIWQVERRVWKLDLIARVDARMHALPVAAPGPSSWASVNDRDDEYRRVTVTGHFLHDRETLVTAVTEAGSGYWVLTPLKTANGLSGFDVLINRGFVPPEKKERDARAPGEVAGDVTVTGLIRMTEPKGGFLRANDVSADRWFSRDVDAIANYASYFIDADATPNPGGFPIGGLTVIDFPNNHLVYAMTWFALALMLCWALIRFLREESLLRRAARRSAEDVRTKPSGARSDQF
jgi:surfeit locus 1 family protein